LHKLADTYPSACKKHDVPVWVYIASDLSMRFHGVHSFHAFPYVVRSGGMVQAFGPEMGHKTVHPQTGDVSLRCEGFNDKNAYARQTPCDQDYLRKMARKTDAQRIQLWFNRDVVGLFRKHRAFDKEGLFIGDGSYLFVPDNPHYEGSVKMRFDESNHPVTLEQYTSMTEAQKSRCQWKRCYKMVTLLHTNGKREFFVFVAVKVISGGQTGADRAGLDFAMAQGIAHGGWCPRGRLAEDGTIPARYQLEETPEADYAQRTEWNVRDADGT
jgi:hypothetical protein